MINDGINDVPDKTIAIFTSPAVHNEDLTQSRIFNMVKKSDKKREWFSPHFYRCLPLTIGNQYGFTIASEFDIGFEWNGGYDTDSIFFQFDENKGDLNKLYPRIDSHFGHGIITINTSFAFRTPPGVNLMTINPPNHVIPNVTVMTGVVETDNLRRSFTFNLKIQIPNIKTIIPAGYPLAAFIPIPRYYADNFKLKFAEDIFSKKIINEELEAGNEANKRREHATKNAKFGVDRDYFNGKDAYGNFFPDHQKP